MRESKRKALTLISAARQGVHKKICKEKLDDSVGEKDEAYPPVSCQDRIALGNYTEELLAMKSEVVDRRPAFRHTEDIQNRTTLCHIGRGSEFMLGIWHLVTAGSSVKDCDQAMNHDFSSQTCPFCYVTMLLHSSIIQYLEHVLKFLFNSPMFGAWGFRLLGGTTFTQIEHMSNFLRDLQSGQNCEKELMICSVCRAFVFLKPPVTKGTERRLQRQKESFIACHMASHGFRDVRSNGEKPSVLIVLPSVSIRLLCNVCFNVSFCMMSWHKHVTLHSITSSHERSVSGSDNSKKWRLSEGSYVRIGPDLNMRNIRKDDVIFYNFSSPLCPVCLENLEKHGLFDLFTHRMQVLFKQNKNHSGTFVKLRFHSKSSPEFIYNSLVGFTEAVIYECESTATSKENWDIFICSVCSCWDVVENIRECCPHPGLLTGKQKLVITSHIEAHDVGRQKLSQKPSLVIEIPSGLVKAICSVCYATFLCIADWRYHLNWHVTDMASSVSAVTKDTTSPEFHTVLSPGREIEQYETQEMKSLAVRQDRRKQTSIKKRKPFYRHRS